MKHRCLHAGWIFLVLCRVAAADEGSLMSQPSPNNKTPSREQVLWTETDVGWDTEAEYDYSPSSRIDFGGGHRGTVNENYMDVRSYFSTRAIMAFLVHTGFEYQRMSFSPSNNIMVPDELDEIKGYFATDFRWSEHDMMRAQIEPGFYSDLKSMGNDINAPLAIAYTRIASRHFQAAIALSIDTWRQNRYLPGGGFNYYFNDTWALKFMLPTPVVQYRATQTLHLTLGADFRGGTYRVSKSFGDDRDAPPLNNAIVEYQEIRVGAGWSWNIRPLIEFNGSVGYIPDRSYTYPHTAFQSHTTGSPYIAVSFSMLFQVVKDTRPIREQLRSMQYEFPSLQRFFKLPS